MVLIALGTSYGLMMGKGRIVSLILSFFPAAFLFRYLPFLKTFSVSSPTTSGDVLTQVLLFLVLLIPIHLLLNHYISSDFSFASPIRKFFESLILGSATASLFILASYQVINIKSFYNFSGGIDNLFTGNLLFYWLLLPFIALFLMK